MAALQMSEENCFVRPSVNTSRDETYIITEWCSSSLFNKTKRLRSLEIKIIIICWRLYPAETDRLLRFTDVILIEI